MTADKDTGSAGLGGKDLGGKDQRPHATLDLTATEVFPDGKPQATDEPRTALPPGDGGEAAPEAAADPAALPPRSGAREADVGSFLTHMAAGLVGAALALVVAFFSLGAFRDSLPFLNEGVSAEDNAHGLRVAEQRIAALEQASRSASGDNGGLASRIKAATDQTGALKQELASLSGRMQSLEAKPAPAAGPSAEAVQHSLEPLNAKLAELEGRIASLTKAQDELKASAGAAALTMAVQNLRRAVTEGKPFAAELKTLASLAPQKLELAPLEARRDSGLASLTKLQHDFDSSARAAIEAAKPSGDGSFTGDLLAKARSLVRVRPKGDIPGTAPEAILARAEQRLDSGDLPAAIRETGQLAGPAADAMTPWLTEAKAKAAADETLQAIEAKLITSLGTDDRSRRGG
jgi:hypothetical protein